MEISDLMPQFMQNHDRLLPETIGKDDQAWKYALFSTKAGKLLIKRQAKLTSTQSLHSPPSGAIGTPKNDLAPSFESLIVG
jgi:hypothetical protein